MTINLTKAQKESIEYDGGDLLIKGAAGSGKSIVLMQRAIHFNQKALKEGHHKKILILTYVNTLVKYTTEIVQSMPLEQNMIEVMKIDTLCRTVYLKMRHMRAVRILQKPAERRILIEKAIQAHLNKSKKHRFHDIDTSFWEDEFKWIKEKEITCETDYIQAERTGRGGKIRMTKEDKAIAYELFTEYCAQLKKAGYLEWEDLYTYIIQHADLIPESLKYDHILVDEAQDLSFVKLRMAKLLAKETITIAADKAQKIYSTSFSWKELGIDIRGKGSKSLSKSFRSTKQIVQLAESLMEINRAKQLDQSEYTDAVLPEREGEPPQIVSCTNDDSERQLVLDIIKAHIQAGDVIGVLYRSFTEKIKITRWLKSARLNYQDLTDRDAEWSLTASGIKLCTLHSSKGLEFDTVIIPMFAEKVLPLHNLLEDADGEQISEIKFQERNLLYVGMTRARYGLFLTYSGTPSEFIYEFNPSYYKYITNSGRLLPSLVRRFNSKQTAPTKPETLKSVQAEKIVKIGSTLSVHIQGSSQPYQIKINTRAYPAQKAFLGQGIGSVVAVCGKTYIIDNIS